MLQSQSSNIVTREEEIGFFKLNRLCLNIWNSDSNIKFRQFYKFSLAISSSVSDIVIRVFHTPFIVLHCDWNRKNNNWNLKRVKNILRYESLKSNIHSSFFPPIVNTLFFFLVALNTMIEYVSKCFPYQNHFITRFTRRSSRANFTYKSLLIREPAHPTFCPPPLSFFYSLFEIYRGTSSICRRSKEIHKSNSFARHGITSWAKISRNNFRSRQLSTAID